MKRCLNCSLVFEADDWLCQTCGWQPDIVEDIPRFAPELDETEQGFDPRAFESLYECERQNFWFRSRNRIITWAIGRYFEGTGKYLEIGCGTGFVLQSVNAVFKEFQCFGSEIYLEGLKYARCRVETVPLFQMDARDIPFRVEFDLIGAFDVLEHIEEDCTVLSQMYDALKPSGGILLTVPQHPFLWSEADEQARHVRRYTRAELVKKVEDAGFEVLRCTSFVTSLLPFMMASRLLKRGDGQPQDAEFQLPGPLNLVFEKTLGLDLAMIKAGVRLPFGGSLLLAAQKPA